MAEEAFHTLPLSSFGCQPIGEIVIENGHTKFGENLVWLWKKLAKVRHAYVRIKLSLPDKMKLYLSLKYG